MSKISYEEFKQLFIREDGKKKNRVILDMWLDKAFREYIKSNPRFSAIHRVRTMADLFAVCDAFVSRTSMGTYTHTLFNSQYCSNTYAPDGNGFCVDGDFRGYRYYNVERDSVFKMKIGKMYKHFIEQSEFGRALPESVKLFMCEEMTLKWIAYTQSMTSGFKLHVDDDFARIYNSDECTDDFNSCMTDGDNYHFYEDAVKAKAAYLTNGEDKIIARCVIYTDAIDVNGKVWRLAERQYSEGGDEVYKRLLIQALIKGGHIDAYKKVGAGCHDPRLWVDVNDNPLAETRFYIQCQLECGDYISYQDSFKWFDASLLRAYNYNPGRLDEVLSTTDDTFEGNWDSWRECCTSDRLVSVYSCGNHYFCSEECLDDFRWVERRDEYHHYDDVTYCDWCNEYALNDDAIHSDITGEYYCCDDCLIDAEQDYKERNWLWSDIDEAYINPDDAAKYHYDGHITAIYKDYADCLVSDGKAVELNGEYYKVED